MSALQVNIQSVLYIVSKYALTAVVNRVDLQLQGGMGSSSGLGQTLAPTSGMGLIQRPSSSSDHLSPPGHVTPTG